MTISENKIVVVRFNKEFIEGGNIEVLKEIVADDFINYTAAGIVSDSIEGLKKFIMMFHRGFSNIHITIHEMIGETDLIATRKTIQATHTGEVMGHKPTGEQVTFNVMDFVRLRDGKYIEHWGQNNIMHVIQQL